jgi:hypothetical protein
MGSDVPEMDHAGRRVDAPPPWDLETYPPDVALVVALREEFLRMSPGWSPRRNETYGGCDYFWIDERSGYRCVATFAGPMGPEEATRETERLQDRQGGAGQGSPRRRRRPAG